MGRAAMRRQPWPGLSRCRPRRPAKKQESRECPGIHSRHSRDSCSGEPVGAEVITRGPDGAPMSPARKPKPPAPEPDPAQSPVRQAAERAHARVASMEGGAAPLTPKEAPTLPPLRADLRLR